MNSSKRPLAKRLSATTMSSVEVRPLYVYDVDYPGPSLTPREPCDYVNDDTQTQEAQNGGAEDVDDAPSGDSGHIDRDLLYYFHLITIKVREPSLVPSIECSRDS